MKITRYKRAQRILTFYQNNFDYREPYQILVDGTFSLKALAMKILLKEQLPKYLGSECDLLTTGCCINEVVSLGPDVNGAAQILKGFILVTCGHAEKPLPASECLKRITRGGNVEKYFVATQDAELQEKLRKQASVPLLYMHQQAITLEKPSGKSEETAKTHQSQKIEPSAYQKEVLDELKKKEFGAPLPDVPRKRKRRGPKMPNPLSCKKSKKAVNQKPGAKSAKPAEGTVAEDVGQKRSRRRNKRLNMHQEAKLLHQKLLAQTGGQNS